MLKPNKVASLSAIAWRSLNTSSTLGANHYDALGLTPKANQNDIKTAYYELSKVYHPDKSKDEASLKKFREISEAYEVLGNVRTKKMYDKGLFTGRENSSRMDYEPEPESNDPTVKFYKSRAYRHVIPTMDGRTPVYDFDTWSKEHYGNLIKKKIYDKELLRKKRQTQQDRINSSHQETMIYLLISLGGLLVLLASSAHKDYDVDKTKKKAP